MRKILKSLFPTAMAMISSLLMPGCALAANEYWEQRVSLFDALPIQESDIVFLGNSITDGGEFAELFGNPSVKNRGISGDVISGVHKRLGQVTRHRPAKIFLLIGINDISHNKSTGVLAAEYEKLVKDIRTESPSTVLYIQSVMPVNNDFKRYKNLTGKENDVTALNACLKDIAARNGAIYIDLTSTLSDPSTGKLRKDFTNDGLHLTGKGYLAWVEAIRGYVE